MADYDVVVIGGGAGGLSAAALCQKAGMKTLVLEQSERIGGCCSTFEAEGFHFDVGASVVEVTASFEELFRRLGLSREKYIPMVPVDPIYDYCDIKRDVRFAYPTSVEETAEVISKISPEDGKTFLKFAKDFTSEDHRSGRQLFLRTLPGIPRHHQVDHEVPGHTRSAPHVRNHAPEDHPKIFQGRRRTRLNGFPVLLRGTAAGFVLGAVCHCRVTRAPGHLLPARRHDRHP